MIIAGLTGGIGYGKTTFATLLAGHSSSSFHFETWELVAEVALALRSENNFEHPAANDIDGINEWLHSFPDIICWHLHVDTTFDDIRLTSERLADNPENYTKLMEYLQLMADNPELADIDITEDNKETFRPLLQWLGGYLVARLGGVWYDEIARRILHLRSSGYELVTVGGVRYPGDAERLRNTGGVILQIERPSLPLQDGNDLTERQRSEIEADAIIINDGSIDELTVLAQRVYNDLRLRQLQPSYDAAKAQA